MKLNIATGDAVDVSATLSSGTFSIDPDDAESQTIISMILSDKLYADKIMAVVREYTCNAADSHVEAGKKNVPIHVTLPTVISPVFIVKDFGTGLTEEDIENIFTKYGKSTKRDSNRVIGVFGIGCKAGFAYGTRTFVVESRIDGRCMTYNCFRDEKLTLHYVKTQDVETSEENGLTIIIPVLKQDIDTFCSRARYLFQYFSVSPIVNGMQFVKKQEDYFLVDPDGKWTLTQNNVSDSVIVMGNVPYPVKYEFIKDTLAYSYAVLSKGLTVNVPMGAVDVSPTRESLEYTEKTQKYLTKIIKHLQESLIDSFQQKLEQFESYSEAAFTVYEYLRRDTYYISQDKRLLASLIRELVDKTYVWSWRGIPIEFKKIELRGLPIRFERYNVYNKQAYADGELDELNIGTCLSHCIKRLNDLTTLEFVYIDQPDLSLNLLYKYMRHKGLRTVTVVHGTVDDINKFFDTSPLLREIKKLLVPLSSLHIPKAVREPVILSDHAKAKILQFLPNGRSDDRKSFWTVVDNGIVKRMPNAIYIEIDHFLPMRKDGHNIDLDIFAEKIALLDQILDILNKPKTPIFGVKTNYIKSLPHGWVNIFDYVGIIVKEYHSKFNITNKLLLSNTLESIDSQYIKATKQMIEHLCHVLPSDHWLNITLNNIDPVINELRDCSFNKFLLFCNSYQHSLTYAPINQPPHPISQIIISMIEDIKKRYPLLIHTSLFSGQSYYKLNFDSGDIVELLVSYIKGQDILDKSQQTQ